MTAFTHKTTAPNGLYLRAGPSTAARIIGLMPFGTPLIVEGTFGGWSRIPLGANLVATAKVNGVDLLRYNPLTDTDIGFCWASWTEPWAEAPPPLPPAARARYRIGVNGLANFYEMERAFELGCRYGMVVNDFAFGSRLMDRFPDAIVMVRRTPFNLDPAAYVHQMEGIGDPRLIYTGMNEGDEIGYTGAALRERCKLSVNYWNQCRARGARHAGLTFSMGTPVIESAEDMQIIHDECAEAFAQGMLFDYHGYSPFVEHADPKFAGDWKWYEHRPREVIRLAKLDPVKTRVTLSEGYVDYGGGGGLVWAVKYGKIQRAAIPGFLEQRRALYERPMVIDGVSYPGPEIGEAGFQMGRNEPEGTPGWGGYALGGYMDILPPVWRVI